MAERPLFSFILRAQNRTPCGMNINTITDLPTELLGEILSQWFDVKSLSRIDSAACSSKVRSTLLELFSSTHFTYSATVPLQSGIAVWLYKRKMKVSRVELNDTRPEVTKYMQVFSPSLQCVRCYSISATQTVGFYCRNAQSLRIDNVHAGQWLGAVLWSNNNLQQLFLHNVSSLQPGYFENISLPQLRSISLQRCLCDDACLSAILCMSDIVQTVDITSSVVSDAGVIALAQRCPLLHSFTAYNVTISDGALAQLSTLCPFITHLDVSFNTAVTDRGVRAVAENLQGLRSISIASCAKVTDISLLHLSKHCASTLTTLCMQHVRLVRVGVLLHMLNHCTHLDTLSFSFDMNGNGLYKTIVPHMSQLKTIVAYTALHENVLVYVAKHCAKLQKLGLFLPTCNWSSNRPVSAAPSAVESVPIDSYYSAELHDAGIEDVRVIPLAVSQTMPSFAATEEITTSGLLALMDFLPQLRCLGMRTLPSELALRLLQRLRPTLQLTDKLEEF